MIDIHAHILPAVDDGSKDLSQSLNMLSESVSIGITDVILTPHYRKKMKPSKDVLIENFKDFCKRVNQAGINVNLYLGQEIYADDDIKSNLLNDRVLSMNGTKYVLVEFAFESICDIAETIYELKACGYKPIVAHPERYFYVDVDTVQEIKNLGGLIQINAQSIVSWRSFRRKKFINKLFELGLVDYVSSDVHAMRKNYMQKAFRYVAKKFGEKVADKVFKTNAEEIIKG